MPKKYEKKTPTASEIFCNEDTQGMAEAKEYFLVGETYDLPFVNNSLGASSTRIDSLFEYVGTAGNNTKLQFREIHGGWTVTLAPRQLERVISGVNPDTKYYKPQTKNGA